MKHGDIVLDRQRCDKDSALNIWPNVAQFSRVRRVGYSSNRLPRRPVMPTDPITKR